MDEHARRTIPSEETREEERREARTPSVADRPPTHEEEEKAERLGAPDPGTSEAYEEMLERGARQRGEGRIP